MFDAVSNVGRVIDPTNHVERSPCEVGSMTRPTELHTMATSGVPMREEVSLRSDLSIF